MAKKVAEETVEQAPVKAVVSMVQKAKLTLTDFNPKQIAAEPDEVRRKMVGTLIGRATGVVERAAPDGSEKKFLGLGGVFEAHVLNRDPVRSGVLFMPDTFIEPLIEILSDQVDETTGEVIKAGANALNIAYKVWVARSNNAQGYSWELEQIIDAEKAVEADPLQNLRGMLTAPNQKMLENPDKK